MATTQPDLFTLLKLFPPISFLSAFEIIPGEQVPPPYQELLVHEHHMTVTVEKHHGSLVNVQVLQEKKDGEDYSRKILLSLQSNGKVVQFGLVRIRLGFCSPEVREKILEGKTPLGRILIDNNVLRRIEPTGFLRILPGPEMMKWFGRENPQLTYGRLAIIHCDGQPAIELLEIVSPES